ncbi:MAG TPA: cation diffusion facilitator family transporter [Kineosporiaceae bacterium]|nr:cation diffusion facilitator family transporter [Kineosporiaceae bacterium]
MASATTGTTAAPQTDTGDSVLTVFVAGAANLLIAVAKGAGALISGSSAMLSEAVHSVADTVTEVLLFVSLRRGGKPADEQHPLGYGREAYLWALLAAVATFVVGALVSIVDGVHRIRSGGDQGDPRVAFAVLGIAFVLEGTSLMRALRQVQGTARRYRVRARTFLQETTDTAVRAVTLEDSAALVGLVLAAVGLALTEITGNSLWDGLGSVLIGVLLVVVAGSLARANTSLLVGRSAPLGVDQALRDELESVPGVTSVPVFVTSVTGPRRLLVAAKVEFRDGCTTDDIERIADEAERRLVGRFPGIEYVFLDPTSNPGDAALRSARRAG